MSNDKVRIDSQGFLTPSWRDKNAPPIGTGANVGFFEELKCWQSPNEIQMTIPQTPLY
jgi:hypothetical protein